MAVKRKRKISTGNTATDRLYSAVRNYVERRGGSLLVIGGIEVQEWPEDNKGCFRVAVKCLGRKPVAHAEGGRG